MDNFQKFIFGDGGDITRPQFLSVTVTDEGVVTNLLTNVTYNMTEGTNLQNMFLTYNINDKGDSIRSARAKMTPSHGDVRYIDNITIPAIVNEIRSIVVNNVQAHILNIEYYLVTHVIVELELTLNDGTVINLPPYKLERNNLFGYKVEPEVNFGGKTRARFLINMDGYLSNPATTYSASIEMKINSLGQYIGSQEHENKQDAIAIRLYNGNNQLQVILQQINSNLSLPWTVVLPEFLSRDKYSQKIYLEVEYLRYMNLNFEVNTSIRRGSSLPIPPMANGRKYLFEVEG